MHRQAASFVRVLANLIGVGTGVIVSMIFPHGGEAELELKAPTLLALQKDGRVLRSVTENVDRIPIANTIAPVSDGRIAFVSRGWGVGVF